MSNKMSSNRYLQPDEDFLLHGKSTTSWKHSGYQKNSLLTNTTSNLNQHSQYNPDNFHEKKKGKKYVRTMSDLANNLECLSNEVDKTLSKSLRYNNSIIDHANQLLYPESLRNSDMKYGGKEFRESKQTSTLSKDLSEDELLGLYEKHLREIDNSSGKLVSPNNSQWLANPNTLNEYDQAPISQSISNRYGKTSQDIYSDRDREYLKYFPVTFGAAFELSAAGVSDAEPLRHTVSLSEQNGRSKSARLTREDTDRHYRMTSEPSSVGSNSVDFPTPHEFILGKLRLQRLRLEEAKLLELKRLEELERIRGPKPKWYESTGPDFHYEAHKNTQLIRSMPRYQDMLDYREDLIRSSRNSLRKYNANKQLTLAC